MMKVFVGLLLVILVGALIFWESLLVLAVAPPVPVTAQNQEPLVMDVAKGATLHGVSERLASEGLIRSAPLFRLYAKLKGESHGLKVGEYDIPRGAGPKQILEILTSGKSRLYSITFPEGSNIFEMASALEQTKVYNGVEFLRLVRDPGFVESLIGQPESSLEGYLFPETYNYTKYTTLKELVVAMVRNFTQAYQRASEGYKGALTREQIVTMASVIEKETGAPQERPLIASVFYNRLHKGMKIQSDPTIIYGYWIETGTPLKNIRKNDITKKSPYNTYVVRALPQGPIANPGYESLRAAMFPAQSDYLYFVSRNDGTHVFTSTYQDHMKAVRDFQLNHRAREGKSWRDLNKQPLPKGS
jgi:UPF0755 protein